MAKAIDEKFTRTETPPAKPRGNRLPKKSGAPSSAQLHRA